MTENGKVSSQLMVVSNANTLLVARVTELGTSKDGTLQQKERC